MKVKGHLKRLILEGCVGVRDEGLSLLSRHNIPVLEVVNMSHCQLLTGIALSSVASVSKGVYITLYCMYLVNWLFWDENIKVNQNTPILIIIIIKNLTFFAGDI